MVLHRRGVDSVRLLIFLQAEIPLVGMFSSRTFVCFSRGLLVKVEKDRKVIERSGGTSLSPNATRLHRDE